MKFILLIAIFFFTGFKTDKESCKIEFNGLYLYKMENSDIIRYLRFYEDGTVLSVDSNDKPQKVYKWLDKDTKNQYLEFARGEYTLKKCKLKFFTQNEKGKFKFEGNVSGNTVKLVKSGKDIRTTTINYTYKIM